MPKLQFSPMKPYQYYIEKHSILVAKIDKAKRFYSNIEKLFCHVKNIIKRNSTLVAVVLFEPVLNPNLLLSTFFQVFL